MKIIANYLPQYHRIPENDKWWGEGFTDWKSAKEAEPVFQGHKQPRLPYNNYYYDLSNLDDIKWQAKLAKDYGISGFGIYHYWFNTELHLLDKPVVLLKDNKDIDIEYMFIWDNISWARTWTNKRFASSWINNDEDKQENDLNNNGMLAELKYGTEKDWKSHFEYLLDFFKDDRYIKIDNKPCFAVFNQNNGSKELKEMFDYWDMLAKESGFSGMYIIGKKNFQNVNITSHLMTYEPAQSALQPDNIVEKIFLKFRTKINKNRKPLFFDYDKTWKRILNNAKKNGQVDIFYSGFVDFDDSPRRGINGRIMKGASPEKFKLYFKELLKISKSQNKEYVFLTAWNEWGEGAYLEPDNYNGYAYLEAVKESLDSL